MTTIQITCKQSSYSFWGKHFGYRTNSNHVVSAIQNMGGYEIIVFSPRGETEKQEWMSTVDEMIKRFSQLVAEYTLELVS